MLWSWWNRPVVEWRISGDILNPSQDGESLVIRGEAKNFGDGAAHQVSVCIHRGEDADAEPIGTTTPLAPGETLAFETTLPICFSDHSVVFVEWTPAPIRRHNVRTSDAYPVLDVFRTTPLVAEAFQKHRNTRD